MTHPNYDVLLTRVKIRGKTMLLARIKGGPKKGQTFSRPEPGELGMDTYWNAMEHQFGGKCFR